VDNALEIKPATGPVRGSIRPPGSKSITNRALICAALADGTSKLVGVLDSEDTRVMIESLKQLGFKLNADLVNATLEIEGQGGVIPATQADLYIANSGTSVRFLTALAALGHGRFRLHGTPRMHQRPIQDLIDPLAQLGVRAECEAGNGCPPVIVHTNGLPGGRAKLHGGVSSQFLSGLLMAAPYATSPVELIVEDALVSKPYVEMTLAVMRSFGIDVPSANLQHFQIAPGKYRALKTYEIEPDASAASYFFATAAITGGEITVDGLTLGSLQGDVAFCDCLQQMGCEIKVQGSGEQGSGSRGQGSASGSKPPALLPGGGPTDQRQAGSITLTGPPPGKKLRGITINMNAISDTVQTLAAVALFADGPTTITGVAHIRHKETDRIGNLAIELRKLGATVDELSDGLRITPGPLHGARIATYDDHRMAMSLSLVGLRVPGIVIENPRCAEKTYPRFFDDLTVLVGGRAAQ
jgi:3-phosphoshikimate 1-carboxyvinyltransferase